MSVPEIGRQQAQLSVLDRRALLRCVEECVECAAMCVACTETDAAGGELRELAQLVRLRVDSTALCIEAGDLVLGEEGMVDDHTTEFRLICGAIEVCSDVCRICAEEVERHAAQGQRCLTCCEACRRCRAACRQLAEMLA